MTPRSVRWTSWILSFLPVAIFLSSAWVRGTHHAAAVAEVVGSYGYPESAIVPIIIAECALVALYLIPQTAVLAAIVMTDTSAERWPRTCASATWPARRFHWRPASSPGVACICGTRVFAS